MSCLYALISTKEPDIIRYIGISKYDTPDDRLKKHLQTAKTGNDRLLSLPIYKWINKNINAGHDIHYILLETGLSWDEACILEKDHISDYRALGIDLLNVTGGGEGLLGVKHSEESIQKIKDYWTPERRAEQRKNTLSRPAHIFTEEEKQKLKESAKKRHKEIRNAGLVWGVDLGPRDRTPKHIKDRIVADHNNGKSFRKIAEELNKEGVPTSNNKKWYATSIKNIYDRYAV